MSKIISLHLDQCLYHFHGVCMYEEYLNPGYHQGFKCEVFLKWQEEYDQLLERAEIFSSPLEIVEQVWAKGEAKRLRQARACPFWQEGENQFCAHLFDDCCLLKFPKCINYCQHFTRRT